MRVLIEESGGFAGIVEDPRVIDTASLPPERGRAVEAAVAQVAAAGHGEIGADLRKYRITVDRGDGGATNGEEIYTLWAGDPSVVPGLDLLLREGTPLT